MAFEMEDGTRYEITEKGVMACLLVEMVPGLDIFVAAGLIDELIEKAVDKAEIDWTGMGG